MTVAAQKRTQSRPFAAYLGTQASWFFAFGLQSVLVPFAAKKILEASDAQFGIVQASLMAPLGFLILFGGVIAERADRRKLLTNLHLMAFVPPMVLAALAATGAWNLTVLIVYGLAMGSVGAIMMPTRDAALNAAADASQGRLTVQRAVVLASMIQFLAQIAGMAAASASAKALGMLIAPDAMGQWLLWLTAALIVIQGVVLGAGALAGIALPPLPPPHPHADLNVAKQLVEGLSIVWNSPAIRPMAFFMVGVGIFVVGMSFFVLLPLLVLDEFGGGLDALGFALIVFWLGAAVTTAALAPLHIHRPGVPMVIALALGAASLGAFAFEPPFTVVVALVFFWGVSGGMGIAMSRTIVQEAAPPWALARVLSVYQLGFVAGAPIGMVIMGFLVEHFDPRTGAFVAMTGVLLLAAWLALFTPVTKLTAQRHVDAQAPAE